MSFMLVVSGYRDFNNYEIFKRELDSFISQYGMPNKILFGDCRGTDHLALQYVKSNNISYEIYPANWNQYGLSAGPKRNNQMIDLCTHLIAFLSPKSKGTLQTINYAKTKNVIIKVIDI